VGGIKHERSKIESFEFGGVFCVQGDSSHKGTVGWRGRQPIKLLLFRRGRWGAGVDDGAFNGDRVRTNIKGNPLRRLRGISVTADVTRSKHRLRSDPLTRRRAKLNCPCPSRALIPS